MRKSFLDLGGLVRKSVGCPGPMMPSRGLASTAIHSRDDIFFWLQVVPGLRCDDVISSQSDGSQSSRIAGAPLQEKCPNIRTACLSRSPPSRQVPPEDQDGMRVTGGSLTSVAERGCIGYGSRVPGQCPTQLGRDGAGSPLRTSHAAKGPGRDVTVTGCGHGSRAHPSRHGQ